MDTMEKRVKIHVFLLLTVTFALVTVPVAARQAAFAIIFFKENSVISASISTTTKATARNVNKATHLRFNVQGAPQAEMKTQTAKSVSQGT
jgi:hypothetical protein